MPTMLAVGRPHSTRIRSAFPDRQLFVDRTTFGSRSINHEFRPLPRQTIPPRLPEVPSAATFTYGTLGEPPRNGLSRIAPKDRSGPVVGLDPFLQDSRESDIMRLRHIAALLTIAAVAQLSTGCHLFHNTCCRIRNHFGCHTCSPAFHTPGPVMSDPGMSYGYPGTVNYGAPDCATCTSGSPAAAMPVMPHGQPVSLGAAPTTTVVPTPPSVALPMPRVEEKKN